MALTAAQLNAHIRTIAADQLSFEKDNHEVLMWWLRASIRHHRLGGADNQEAAITVSQFVSQQVLGRALTAQDLHALLKHQVTEADPTAGGVLG